MPSFVVQAEPSTSTHSAPAVRGGTTRPVTTRTAGAPVCGSAVPVRCSGASARRPVRPRTASRTTAPSTSPRATKTGTRNDSATTTSPTPPPCSRTLHAWAAVARSTAAATTTTTTRSARLGTAVGTAAVRRHQTAAATSRAASPSTLDASCRKNGSQYPPIDVSRSAGHAWTTKPCPCVKPSHTTWVTLPATHASTTTSTVRTSSVGRDHQARGTRSRTPGTTGAQAGRTRNHHVASTTRDTARSIVGMPHQECAASYGGRTGAKSTASGAIDPTATAATGTGRRRAARATTAWLTVNGISGPGGSAA